MNCNSCTIVVGRYCSHRGDIFHKLIMILQKLVPLLPGFLLSLPALTTAGHFSRRLYQRKPSSYYLRFFSVFPGSLHLEDIVLIFPKDTGCFVTSLGTRLQRYGTLEFLSKYYRILTTIYNKHIAHISRH